MESGIGLCSSADALGFSLNRRRWIRKCDKRVLKIAGRPTGQTAAAFITSGLERGESNRLDTRTDRTRRSRIVFEV